MTHNSPWEQFAAAEAPPDGDIVACETAAGAVSPRSAPPPLSPTNTVAEARAVLDASQTTAALVADGGRPVGVVTDSALRGRPGHVPRPGAALADVMDFEVIRADPGADVLSTLHTYTEAAWVSLRRRRPCAPDRVASVTAAFESSSRGQYPPVGTPKGRKSRSPRTPAPDAELTPGPNMRT